MKRTAALALLPALLLAALPLRAAVDLDRLWDYAQPAQTEARLRAALAGTAGADHDDALILRAQIARSLGLQRRYDAALRELDALQPLLAGATVGPAPRVHALLERGRVLRSSGQPAAAEPWFHQAFDLAEPARLEFLAADALHMLALVQPDIERQIAWNRRVVAYAQNAADPRARRWEAAALNNIGVALNEAGRSAEALPVLRQAQAAYERAGNAVNVRIARWMVAHTLRLLGRLDEALAALRALEADWAAAGGGDADVFEELAEVHAARGDADRAAYYRALSRKAQ
ncbi:MAG: tetratricopeptide repeat protein [Rubrivivax sp.]